MNCRAALRTLRFQLLTQFQETWDTPPASDEILDSSKRFAKIYVSWRSLICVQWYDIYIYVCVSKIYFFKWDTLSFFLDCGCAFLSAKFSDNNIVIVRDLCLKKKIIQNSGYFEQFLRHQCNKAATPHLFSSLRAVLSFFGRGTRQFIRLHLVMIDFFRNVHTCFEKLKKGRKSLYLLGSCPHDGCLKKTLFAYEIKTVYLHRLLKCFCRGPDLGSRSFINFFITETNHVF